MGVFPLRFPSPSDPETEDYSQTRLHSPVPAPAVPALRAGSWPVHRQIPGFWALPRAWTADRAASDSPAACTAAEHSSASAGKAVEDRQMIVDRIEMIDRVVVDRIEMMVDRIEMIVGKIEMIDRVVVDKIVVDKVVMTVVDRIVSAGKAVGGRIADRAVGVGSSAGSPTRGDSARDNWAGNPAGNCRQNWAAPPGPPEPPGTAWNSVRSAHNSSYFHYNQDNC